MSLSQYLGPSKEDNLSHEMDVGESGLLSHSGIFDFSGKNSFSRAREGSTLVFCSTTLGLEGRPFGTKEVNGDQNTLSSATYVNAISQEDSVNVGIDRQVKVDKAGGFLWVTGIGLLFVTGSAFFGWSVSLEMEISKLEEEPFSSQV
jgi:hypothetical protein